MSYNTKKRKHKGLHHPSNRNDSYRPQQFPEEPKDPDPALFIQAHEADIFRGPHAKAAAESLEIYEYDYNTRDPRASPSLKIGGALIRWGAEAKASTNSLFIEDDDLGMPPVGGGEDETWVDRYDACLLLDTLPPKYPLNSAPVPSSPGGWSDLPSDSEDMFFFSTEEIEDIKREKRRKVMERDHEERLKARMAEDGEEPVEEQDVWGGSDEEAEETQVELMKRTANHLLSSPNPAQLEMRILANHGNDKRFAFLRGRWSRTWRLVKGKARIEKGEKENANAKVKEKTVGLGGLAGYGDSDAEDDDDDNNEEEKQKEENAAGEAKATDEKGVAVPEVSVLGTGVADEDTVKEARKLRAKQWAERRRAEKEAEK